MKVCFDKCSDAITYANKTKTYGAFFSSKNEADCTIHVHECCEIFLCLSGGKNFLINDRVYDVNAGDLFIINQFEAHKISFFDDSTFSRFVMQVHPDFLLSSSSDKTDLSYCFYKRDEDFQHKISLSDENLYEIEKMFFSLTKESPFADDILKNATVLKLLAFINMLFVKNNESFDYPRNSIVQNTILYINQNFAEDLTLGILAGNAFISVNQLCRLFKRDTGTTITKYIASKRISEAKRLLRKGKSVSEVSEKCGYRDYANFIRAFKSIVGVSPGKYANYETNEN